ncbi:MAG: fused MFS/spermidine synthase, partial [Ghiorsea sp.]
GATFPVLVRLIVTAHTNVGSVVARLYFANLIGAVSGVILSGFVLIEMLGLRETNDVAVAINLSVGIAALLLARRTSFVASSPTVEEVNPAVCQRDTRVLLGALFISGLAAMAYEVFWTRMLVFQIGSTIYTFALILAIFLCSLSAGSLMAKVVVREWSFTAFAAIQALMGFGALSGLYIVGYAPWVEYTFLPRTNGWGDMLLVHSLIALPVVAPAAFFSGMIIPLAAGLMVREGIAGLAMGRIYLANTAGAFLGPLFAGFMLMPLIGIRWGIILIAALQVVLAILLLLRSKRRHPLAAVFIGLLLLLSLSWSSGGHLRSTVAILNAALYEPLFYREGQSGTVSVFRDSHNGSRMLDINGFVAAGTGNGYAYMQMMGHLPALLHSDPREALVIGLGTGATAASLLKHSLERLTVAEINSAVVEAAPFSRSGNLGLLNDPRLHLFIEDGRNLLTRLPQRYDLIVLEPMPPYFAGVVNLYTEEFYTLAASRLNTDGILCQWLPLHLLSPEMLSMVLQSFLPAFDDVLVWLQPESNIAMMLGVKGSFALNTERLDKHVMQPKIAAALAEAGVLSTADLIDHFVMNRELSERLAADTPVISDNHPLLEFAGVRAMRYGMATRYGQQNVEKLRSCGEALQLQHDEAGRIKMIAQFRDSAICTP